MKYIIIWALFNVHTQDVSPAYPEVPYKEYTANDCHKALIAKGIQKPDKDGDVRLYECIIPGRRSTMQSTEL